MALYYIILSSQPKYNVFIQNLLDSCKLKDDDVCLQTSPGWGSDYTCSNSIQYCTTWAKDMRRCCPISCSRNAPDSQFNTQFTGSFTHADCISFDGKGTCRYPNSVQCKEPCKYF